MRLIVALLLLGLAAPAWAADRYATNNGNTTGTCTSATAGTNGPCRLSYFLTVLQQGETGYLLDGVYQGATNMLNLADFVPGKSGVSDGTRYTVRAVNDGAVFIDGQMSNGVFRLSANNYWTFIGFDVGNSGGNFTSVVDFNTTQDNHHLIFQRICASNARADIWTSDVSTQNRHVWSIAHVRDSLFEDICGFGTGRDTFLEFDPTGVNGNIHRRVWLRWEGWPTLSDNQRCGAPGMQTGYGTNATSLYENVIEIYSAEQMTSRAFWGVCYQGVGNPPSAEMYNFQNGDVRASYTRDGPPTGKGDRWRGYLLYGYGSHPSGAAQPLTYGWKHFKSDVFPADGCDSIVDLFIDGRTQSVPPLAIDCVVPSADRATLIKDGTVQPGFPTIYSFVNNNSRFGAPGAFGGNTNFNECTTLGACPDFYTGTLGGASGARNCFEYSNGTLSTTPLWPWRMDTRIKAALNRAHSAGTGGTALLGSAGSGYDAQTVTSEIVSRYGPIPAQCSRSTTGPAAPSNLRFVP